MADGESNADAIKEVNTDIVVEEDIDESEMGDDYLGHSMSLWSENREEMEKLAPKDDLGNDQEITQCAYVDIDGDATYECLALTKSYKMLVFDCGNGDGIADLPFRLCTCFDKSGVSIYPSTHAVRTYEGVSIGYERDNIYIYSKSKVATVYTYTADPLGGGNVKFTYTKTDRATGKVTTISESAFESAREKYCGGDSENLDKLSWWDY